MIHIPSSSVLAVFAEDDTLNEAIAIYLFTWMIVIILFLITVLRKSAAFVALFGFLSITFLVLAVGDFVGNLNVVKGGGILGCITAFIAYYIGLAELLVAEKKAVTTTNDRQTKVDDDRRRTDDGWILAFLNHELSPFTSVVTG